MKTFYLIKSFLPLVFLPIAPSVVQIELERQGLGNHGGGVFLSILVQVLFTLDIVLWLVSLHNRKNQAKAFLKMSCVSKKVFHEGRWMTVERYLAEQHNITVSHGMTPEESTDWLRESEESMRSSPEADAGEIEVPAEEPERFVVVK